MKPTKRPLASTKTRDLEKPYDAKSFEAAMRAAQRAWIAYRDADCKDLTAQEWSGGTGTTSAVLGCMTEKTMQRTKDLKERYGRTLTQSLWAFRLHDQARLSEISSYDAYALASLIAFDCRLILLSLAIAPPDRLFGKLNKSFCPVLETTLTHFSFSRSKIVEQSASSPATQIGEKTKIIPSLANTSKILAGAAALFVAASVQPAPSEAARQDRARNADLQRPRRHRSHLGLEGAASLRIYDRRQRPALTDIWRRSPKSASTSASRVRARLSGQFSAPRSIIPAARSKEPMAA